MTANRRCAFLVLGTIFALISSQYGSFAACWTEPKQSLSLGSLGAVSKAGTNGYE